MEHYEIIQYEAMVMEMDRNILAGIVGTGPGQSPLIEHDQCTYWPSHSRSGTLGLLRRIEIEVGTNGLWVLLRFWEKATNIANAKSVRRRSASTSPHKSLSSSPSSSTMSPFAT
mmetsp:Transcript_3790/g.10054  ORF Transcript_3790/g.10054 Transcript_3790/m.10054 type:complete len:114 (-) Transcript_3790:292-633(-)